MLSNSSPVSRHHNLFVESVLKPIVVDRSLFSLMPGRAFYKDLWYNKVLFWSVVGGMISVVLRKWRISLTLDLF